MVKIIPFQTKYQAKVNLLLVEIAKEFQDPISTPSPSPSTTAISKVLDNYWIALEGEVVVGTVAIMKIKAEYAILKKMFVRKSHRGKAKGIANLLLDTAFQWCKQEKISTIFLGTMLQFKGAHRFYGKNGFQEIDESVLPADFIHNPIDEVFYVKDIFAEDGKSAEQ
ncbi:MAG: GNAT family N-acetyltransferase [Saprospiraceae bacterium]